MIINNNFLLIYFILFSTYSTNIFKFFIHLYKPYSRYFLEIFSFSRQSLLVLELVKYISYLKCLEINLITLIYPIILLSYHWAASGRLKKLAILKADRNAITQLTPAIGSCSSLTDVYFTENLLAVRFFYSFRNKNLCY